MGRTARKKILLVDDEKDFLEVTSHYLGSLGYQVQTAETGEKALSVVQKDPPDLILLDIILPRMKGVEICANIKADPATSHILILFLTAIPTSDHVETMMKLGAVGYLTKPFRLEQLKEQIEKVFQAQESVP